MAMIAAVSLALLTMFSVLSTASSPIKIKSCDVAYIDDSTSSGGVMTSSLEFTNGVTLTVTNTSAKTVTGFSVAGSYDKFHVTDSWSGKLRPGAQLAIFKHYAQLPYDGSKAKCAVVSATYDDGSTWTPAPSPSP